MLSELSTDKDWRETTNKNNAPNTTSINLKIFTITTSLSFCLKNRLAKLALENLQIKFHEFFNTFHM